MLDTNIVIYTMKNRPDRVRRAFNAHAQDICISSITYSELVGGALRSMQVERNLADVEGFVSHLDVLPFERHDAAHGGEIRAELAGRGRSIGAYDALIAGHARARGLILVTNNMREFRPVPGLRLENWAR
jgi:tRNA(fMet)-specific endonuclease VapC